MKRGTTYGAAAIFAAAGIGVVAWQFQAIEQAEREIERIEQSYDDRLFDVLVEMGVIADPFGDPLSPNIVGGGSGGGGGGSI